MTGLVFALFFNADFSFFFGEIIGCRFLAVFPLPFSVFFAEENGKKNELRALIDPPSPRSLSPSVCSGRKQSPLNYTLTVDIRF